MIGIVGGGITGLALGTFLEERGAPFRIWEAADRAGGVIRTSIQEGRVLEHGPQRTRSTPAVDALVSRAGMGEEVVRVPRALPLFVYRDGQLRRVPFSVGELLTTDLLSLRGKLRLGLEPLTRRPVPEETVARLFTRKFGAEAYRALLGPLFGGLYGSDPGEMYVGHALDETLHRLGARRSVLGPFLRGALGRSRTPVAFSFRRGLQSWTDALAQRLGDRLVTGTPVTEIRRTPAGWMVRTPAGEERATSLVLTAPGGRAAELLAAEAPESAQRLRRLTYNRLALVHLLADGPDGGLGYQVAYGEALRTRGVTWNAPALGRNGVYTAFLGGARDPEALELTDPEVGEIAGREFREVTGFQARVLNVSRTRVPAWDQSWAALEGLSLPEGIILCTNYESRIGIPGRVEQARSLAEALARAPAAREQSG